MSETILDTMTIGIAESGRGHSHSHNECFNVNKDSETCCSLLQAAPRLAYGTCKGAALTWAVLSYRQQLHQLTHLSYCIVCSK